MIQACVQPLKGAVKAQKKSVLALLSTEMRSKRVIVQHHLRERKILTCLLGRGVCHQSGFQVLRGLGIVSKLKRGFTGAGERFNVVTVQA